MVGSFVFISGSVVNIIFGNNVVLNFAVTIAMLSFFSLFCFKLNIYLSLFYALILTVLSGVLEFVLIIAVTWLTGSAFFDYNNDLSLFILECPISKILYFFAVLLLSWIIRPRERSTRLPVTLFLYPVTTAICLFLFWYICAQGAIPHETQNLLALASLCLLVSTVLLFITYQHQVEKESVAMRIKSEYERLQTEKSYYSILDQQNQQLMIFAHDIKNHLGMIGSMTDEPRVSQYLSQLSRQLSDYTHSCHSGNKLLDVIINKYTVECKMRELYFDYNVRQSNLSEIEDTDLVAIIANLMDNAVSAAEMSAERKISLETTTRNSYCVLIISNSCDQAPRAGSNGLITSKEDNLLHGFGLKSVSKALKKYGGDYEWDYDKCHQIFTITVMMRIKV